MKMDILIMIHEKIARDYKPQMIICGACLPLQILTIRDLEK